MNVLISLSANVLMECVPKSGMVCDELTVRFGFWNFPIWDFFMNVLISLSANVLMRCMPDRGMVCDELTVRFGFWDFPFGISV